MKMMCVRAAALVAGVLVGLAGTAGGQLENGFTYQGRLLDAGAPADGDYEVRLELFDAESGGMPFLTIPFQPVTAEDGLFDVGFNYNDELFDRPGRVFVQIAVRRAGEGGFTVLAPRQQIDAAPLADKANIADIAVEALEAPATTLTEAYQADSTLTTDSLFQPLAITGSGGVAFDLPTAGVSFASNTRLFGQSFSGDELWAIEGGSNQFSSSLFSNSDGPIMELGSNVFGDGAVLYLFPEQNEARSPVEDGAFLFSNLEGFGDGALLLGGPQADIILQTAFDGDGSVILPAGSISPSETSAEAGVSSAAIGTNFVPLDTLTRSVLTETIVAPADGFVIALGTAQLRVPPNVVFDLGLSLSETSFPSEQDFAWQFVGAAGDSTVTASPHGVFGVDEGETLTVSMVARTNGDGARALDRRLTLLFVPTAYGTTTLSGVQAGRIAGDDELVSPGVTQAEVNAEILATLEAERQRGERERAELRAQIEALHAELRARGRE